MSQKLGSSVVECKRNRLKCCRNCAAVAVFIHELSDSLTCLLKRTDSAKICKKKLATAEGVDVGE